MRQYSKCIETKETNKQNWNKRQWEKYMRNKVKRKENRNILKVYTTVQIALKMKMKKREQETSSKQTTKLWI